MNIESIGVLLSNLNSNERAIPPWANCIMNGMKEILFQLKGMCVACWRNTISELKNERLNDALAKIAAWIDDSEQRNRHYCLMAHGIKEDDSESTKVDWLMN